MNMSNQTADWTDLKPAHVKAPKTSKSSVFLLPSCCTRPRLGVSMEAGSSLGLKRRYEEVDNSSAFSTPKDSDDDISSSDSADSCDSLNPPTSAPFTREDRRRNVTPVLGLMCNNRSMISSYTQPPPSSDGTSRRRGGSECASMR